MESCRSPEIRRRTASIPGQRSIRSSLKFPTPMARTSINREISGLMKPAAWGEFSKSITKRRKSHRGLRLPRKARAVVCKSIPRGMCGWRNTRQVRWSNSIRKQVSSKSTVFTAMTRHRIPWVSMVMRTSGTPQELWTPSGALIPPRGRSPNILRPPSATE